MNRAIIFAHYDKQNIIDNYVYFYLKALQQSSSYLVFISTSKLSEKDIINLSQYCTKIIVRENIGYDFMSYKVGLDSLDYKSYDEVVICNDSVYGPVYNLKNIFDDMQNKKCDFWGITDNKDIQYHLQSYFIVFRKNILQSQIFQNFWDNLKVLDNKNDIIKKYEVGLTQTLINIGFTTSVYSNFRPTNIQKIGIFFKKLTLYQILKKINNLLTQKNSIKRIGKLNFTHYFYKELLVFDKVPFIEIELLRDNPMNVNLDEIENVINKLTDYDINLIKNHLSRIQN